MTLAEKKVESMFDTNSPNLILFAFTTSLLPWLCHAFSFYPISNLQHLRTENIPRRRYIANSSVIILQMNQESNSSTSSSETSSDILDPKISSQFKIITCSSTACKKQMQKFGLDEYAILGGLYQRKQDANAFDVTVEETSCLGGCKVGPCVGVEHEDYFGTVGLEGMKPNEFNDSIFHK